MVPVRSGPVSLIALVCWATVVATSCQKTIDQRQARAIAGEAVTAYAKRTNLTPQDFELSDFDDSGRVVDWFYAFTSSTHPVHVVSVLVDRHGGFEVHHIVDPGRRGVR